MDVSSHCKIYLGTLCMQVGRQVDTCICTYLGTSLYIIRCCREDSERMIVCVSEGTGSPKGMQAWTIYYEQEYCLRRQAAQIFLYLFLAQISGSKTGQNEKPLHYSIHLLEKEQEKMLLSYRGHIISAPRYISYISIIGRQVVPYVLKGKLSTTKLSTTNLLHDRAIYHTTNR